MTKIAIESRYPESSEVRTDSLPYDAYYQTVAAVFDMSKITSFCDVGCATGHLQKAIIEKHPNTRIQGFEFFDYHRKAADPSIADTIAIVDLRDPLQHDSKYDLVNCTEVGEHIDPDYADAFLQNVKSLVGRFLIMSWSDSGGEHDLVNDNNHQHLNPLPYAQFCLLMQKNGFVELPEVSERLKKASYRAGFHDWWRKSLSVWKVQA